MSTLYIVATPIGNLGDISKRALEALQEVDLILCEDTRVTQKLLNYYQIQKPTISYHHHSKLKKIEHILTLLDEEKNIALVSDAGTPGISDPGNKLVQKIVETINQVKIIPIPGPSALTALASVSGLPMDKFLFMGFPPTKRKRNKFFGKIIESEYPVIFFESPYRILKTLKELGEMAVSKEHNIRVIVGRELTKKFETIYRGTIDKVVEDIKKDKVKGEFIVITSKL